MSRTYYIAWHPEHGIRPATEDGGAFCAEEPDIHVINRREKIDGWTIKPVRIIEEDKVRELWECFRNLSSCSYDHDYGVCRDDVEDLLDSILPEPKATREKHE